MLLLGQTFGHELISFVCDAILRPQALLSSTTAAGIDDNMPGRDDDTHRYHGMIALLGLAYKQGIPLELSFRHSGNASPLTSSTVSNGSPTASAVILHCLLAADDDLRCCKLFCAFDVIRYCTSFSREQNLAGAIPCSLLVKCYSASG